MHVLSNFFALSENSPKPNNVLRRDLPDLVVPEPDPVWVLAERDAAGIGVPAECVCAVLVLDAGCDRWKAGETHR